MRVRTTRPNFYTSETIGALKWSTRHVLKALESYVDDNGVGKDDIVLFATQAFPRDLAKKPSETFLHLQEAVTELEEHNFVVRYEHQSEKLIYVMNWKDVMYVNKPSKGRFPRPDGTLEYSEPVDNSVIQKATEDYFPSQVDYLPQVGGRDQGVGGREQGDSEAKASAPQASTQTLVAEWIDHCGKRPPGRVVGQVSKELKTMVDEGIPLDDVRSGLMAWHQRSLHPSTLASVVHEIRNPRQATSTTDQRVTQGLSLVEQFRGQEQPRQQALGGGYGA